MTPPAVRTPLAALLAGRIRASGPITFAEFMEACLYHPEYGYYSRAESRRHADYYTSVDVHPIFGRLLARQFHQMWMVLDRPDQFWLVECGAGSGRLAGHILDFIEKQFGEFYSALRYVAVERSAGRRSAHAAALARHSNANRVTSAPEIPPEVPVGCIFSNELLDALPVHRVIRERGALREIFVGLKGEELIETSGALSTPAIAEYFSRQRIELAEDQQAEAGLAACKWIESAGARLGRGFILTIDYGHEVDELYNERHMRGTLLAYEQHRTCEDYDRAPGEQDLTAHVNFTALDLWGRSAGLERAGLVSQSHFLLALGRQNEFADLHEDADSETERLRSRLSLKNLIHPEGMGETFQVFVQYKGIELPRLTGLEPV
jgi:SAM-dependent MidA family methyltransferase